MIWFFIISSLLLLCCLLLYRIKPRRYYKPLISIILVVSNEENSIEGLLRNIMKMQQQLIEFELIVIDNNSNDQTPLILLKLSTVFNFKYFSIKQKGIDPLSLGIIHASCIEIYYIESCDYSEPRVVIAAIYNELLKLKVNVKKTRYNKRVIKKIGS